MAGDGVYMMPWFLMPAATFPMGALVDAIGAPITAGCGAILLAVCVVLLFSMHHGSLR